jgi:phospholipid/cholesterol/gamma-HCH transport system substrate-binding protein
MRSNSIGVISIEINSSPYFCNRKKTDTIYYIVKILINSLLTLIYHKKNSVTRVNESLLKLDKMSKKVFVLFETTLRRPYLWASKFSVEKNNYIRTKKNILMSNEVKIGILAIVTIALSFWGYKFILGKNMLVKTNMYKVIYQEVEGMQVGTQVWISGVPVGSVASINLQEDQSVLVVLDMERGIRIPKNTVATIIATGFMGGKAINLNYDRPCEGAGCAQSGDFIQGQTKGLVSSMMGEENLENYVNIIKTGLQDVIDTLNHALLSKDSQSPIAESVRSLQSTLDNLKSATYQVDRLVRNSSSDIDQAMSSLSSITGNIASKNDQISNIIDQADSISHQLATANLKGTLQEVNTAVAGLKNTLQAADQTLNGVSTTVDRINQGEGSLGKLLNDDVLYENINDLSHRADSLINDIQERPYRYMPLKSRRKVKKFDRQDQEKGVKNEK